MKKYFVVLALACASALLSGCEEKTPRDQLTSETVRPITEQDTTDGLIVADFKKDNGWQDTNAVNTYDVRYSYNLKLTKPYPEVVLGLAKEIFSERHEGAVTKGDLATAMAAYGDNLNIYMTVSNWIDSQKDFPSRRDAFLLKCRPCISYWNQSGSEDVINERRSDYILAWITLEADGFKDTSSVGDTVPRSASAGFMKTEQGWKAISPGS